MAYKKDQGRMVRLAAFWSLAILWFYGCTSLHSELTLWSKSLATPIADIRIPVIGLDLSGAVLISAVALFAGLWVLYRWQNTPKNADLLVETESELRKVTWPTLDEAINGSVVVILCVLVLMAFLAGADWVLGRWARVLFLGSM